MKKLAKDLAAAKAAASLAITELAAWFDVDYSTMRKWLAGTIPHTHKHAHITARLDLLHKAIKRSKKLPVPVSLNFRDRMAYVLKVRDDFTGRVSASRTTR